MSQDKIADALNMMENALKAGITEIETPHYSKLLLSVLAIAKLKRYVKDYKIEQKASKGLKKNVLKIELGNLNYCIAIKPRYLVKANEIERFAKRFLPSKELGILIISTSKGLMTHQTAIEKNLGGSLIACIY